ncbi:hypothetical protein ILYODFUR_027670 [Ilyodon furcidens]|uniref:Uncharacterized protein n=1 Tax=Ilyodon furcidens TaxID=33524 RepID=A0ABV0U1X4_9TELE
MVFQDFLQESRIPGCINYGSSKPSPDNHTTPTMFHCSYHIVFLKGFFFTPDVTGVTGHRPFKSSTVLLVSSQNIFSKILDHQYVFGTCDTDLCVSLVPSGLNFGPLP